MDALFQVGWRGATIDFAVRCDICALNLEEFNEFRKMIVVGIGTMEDMWRREQESRNPAQCNSPTSKRNS